MPADAKTLSEWLQKRPPNRAAVGAHKCRMIVAGYVEKNAELGLAKNISGFNASLILARWDG